MTLLLSASVVDGLVTDLDFVFDSLYAGFTLGAEASGISGQRVRTDLPASGSATALLPGLLPEIPAYTVKVNTKFPEASPAIRGIVCMHSLHDGELLALLDSAAVTAWRTGLSAALATDVLARKDAVSVGLIGAGTQVRTTLRGLAHRRRLERVAIHDTNRQRSLALAELVVREFGLASEVCEAPSAVSASGDIVVIATWSKTPLLHAHDTHSGQHLTSIGVDELGKQELAPDLLDQARLIVDDRELTGRMGATANANLPLSAIDATLSEVLLGQHVGRTSDSEVTVYSSVGLPWQDLAFAWPIYRRAKQLGQGLEVNFLA